MRSAGVGPHFGTPLPCVIARHRAYGATFLKNATVGGPAQQSPDVPTRMHSRPQPSFSTIAQTPSIAARHCCSVPGSP